MTCPLPRQARPGMAKTLTARRVPGGAGRCLACWRQCGPPRALHGRELVAMVGPAARGGWRSGPQCAARPRSPRCSACESAPAAAGGCYMTTVRRNIRTGNGTTATGQLPAYRAWGRVGSSAESRPMRDLPV